jgi:hypothetical protein
MIKIKKSHPQKGPLGVRWGRYLLAHPLRACQESAVAVALRQVAQDEVGTVRYVCLWQNTYLISERRIGLSESLILRNCRFQAVTPLLIGSIYLRPRRRKEDPTIEPMGLTERDQCRLAGQMLKGNGSVDQASVKKYPPAERSG